MTVRLIHGFNVRDGGLGTVGRLRPYIPGAEIVHDYGWTGLAGLRCKNARAVAAILPYINRGDVLVGHSNGALICWEIAQRAHKRIGAVVVINPAMRRDTRWPDGLPVLCLANSADWVVQLGRAWSRLVSLGGITPHGWGAAGRYGFTGGQPNVSNWDTAETYWGSPVRGHSEVFRPGADNYWGRQIANWLAITPGVAPPAGPGA